MKKKINFPCKCGHSRRLHGYAGISIGDEWCDSSRYCDCVQYVSDNLKYLEKRYRESKNKKGKKK